LFLAGGISPALCGCYDFLFGIELPKEYVMHAHARLRRSGYEIDHTLVGATVLA
jgi:hypothetical protein